jgi:hypothetical protein
VLLDRLRDPVLLRPPLAGFALVEGLADLAVELVDLHRVEPVLELIELLKITVLPTTIGSGTVPLIYRQQSLRSS